MKNLSPTIQAHLATGATTLAWCWRITRADGEVLGFTDHDTALSFDGTSFEPENGADAPEAVRWPAPITMADDGDVPLPAGE